MSDGLSAGPDSPGGQLTRAALGNAEIIHIQNSQHLFYIGMPNNAVQ
jgi:hypothetical protein